MSRFLSGQSEPDRDDDRVYLLVQRGLYLRPNGSFTNLKALAGRFSLLDAIPARSAIVVHESHAPADAADLTNAAHGLPPRGYRPPPPAEIGRFRTIWAALAGSSPRAPP